ncbi:hypothetical protein [Caballeronia sp. 15711]|jgi:hypothetical protein
MSPIAFVRRLFCRREEVAFPLAVFVLLCMIVSYHAMTDPRLAWLAGR